MKSSKHLVSIAAFAFAAAANAQQPEQSVAVRTDGLPTHIALKVKEKAQQGPTALRRYINNTRMVNALDIWAITDVAAPTTLATEEKSPRTEQLARAEAPRE